MPLLKTRLRRVKSFYSQKDFRIANHGKRHLFLGIYAQSHLKPSYGPPGHIL